MGLVCTFIVLVHIIPEFAKEGCTATLYMHGWTHKWFNPRTPRLFSGEARDRDLMIAKRYPPDTSTQQDANICETLKRERNQKLVRKKQKVSSAKVRAPVRRNVVLEACMVAANVLWGAIFVHLLHHLFQSQEAGGCTILMHTNTRSIKCTFVGAKEKVDVSCACGSCGAKRGMRRWVSAELETVQAWPTLVLRGRAQFISRAAHRKSPKTGKGKCAAELAPNPNPTTSSFGIAPPCEREDRAASFQGPGVLTTERLLQPARKAKWMCIPIVDSDIDHQLWAHWSSSSSISTSSSSDNSSEGPSGADSGNGGQDVSGCSTASATDSDSSTSSSSNTETTSRSKKYHRVALHIEKDVVDVDAMSNDACPVCMLGALGYSVRTSS